MAKIQLIVGPIASGKSTYCYYAAQRDYVICTDDAILNCIHANQYLQYRKEWKPLYKTVENSIVNTALLMGLSVIVDSGRNCKATRRRRFISWAHSFDMQVEAVVFPNEGPEIHGKRRFEADSRGHTLEYWMRVAQAHQDIYTEPSLSEGFDKIFYVTWNEVKNGKVF